MTEVDAILDHMRPSPDGRITARQAAERMEAGLKCRWCERADLKLIANPNRLRGYGCAKCTREDKREKQARRKDGYQQKTYGITQAEKQAIIEEQDGGCMCTPWTNYDGSSGRDLSTDHDHKTGEVRGVLCKHCNDLLGRIHDDPAYFHRMIAYLKNPPAHRVVGSRVVPNHGS